MKIAIIGTGYVGLTTAAVFSELGNEVIGVDIDQDKIERLKKGEVPIFEPTLAEYLDRNSKAGRLSFTTSYKDAVDGAEVIFICVGTPSQSDGKPDSSFILNAAEEVAKNLKSYAVMVIKSTSPIGIGQQLNDLIAKHTKEDFDLAACPEFLREGTAVEDSFNPDRIVIGTKNKKAEKILLDLHKPLPGERVLCDIKSAQLIKYASNAFLATKISFANAIAIICEKTGANVKKVMQGMGIDSRIGSSFLNAGLGYGGSCLPKDISAFIALSSDLDYDFNLLKSVEKINNDQIQNFVSKITNSLGFESPKNLKGVKIAVLGLAFKPNTDDIREAPSLKIIRLLLDSGAQITAYDPKAMENTKKVFPNIEYAKNPYSAATDANALVIITEWPEFREMDLEKIRKNLKKPIIVDGRNIFEKNRMAELGFKYLGIGI